MCLLSQLYHFPEFFLEKTMVFLVFNFCHLLYSIIEQFLFFRNISFLSVLTSFAAVIRTFEFILYWSFFVLLRTVLILFFCFTLE